MRTRVHQKGDGSPVRLIILCGLSFAGKSTLADAICAAFGHSQVDVDETKSVLYGPCRADEDLSADEWARIYEQTDDQIRAHLRNGETVVDASRNFTRRERHHACTLAEQIGARIVLVYVDAPEALIRRRWAENRNKHTRRDVSDKGFEEIISAMEPPTADESALVFEHDDDIQSWLARHAACL
jgi:predicted kinase